MPIDTTERAGERREMIAALQAAATRLPSGLRAAVEYPGVLDAMATVPREAFVPEERRDLAYRPTALDIGHGQTISQPLIVAVMTGLLRPAPDHKVLEIGTGSGYQAAVLARLVAEVYSIEVVGALSGHAADALAGLGITNVHLRIGDGRAGWPEAAPFDGIIVTAAAAGDVPPPLLDQLKPGGRLVAPVGDKRQNLMLAEKDASGAVVVHSMLPVRFVPLI